MGFVILLAGGVEKLAVGSVEIKVDILVVLYYIIEIEHLFAWRIT